jgi:hypothetical protein
MEEGKAVRRIEREREREIEPTLVAEEPDSCE